MKQGPAQEGGTMSGISLLLKAACILQQESELYGIFLGQFVGSGKACRGGR